MGTLVRIPEVRHNLGDKLERPARHCATYAAHVYLLLDLPSEQTPAVRIGFLFEERHRTCNILLGLVDTQVSLAVLRTLDARMRAYCTQEAIRNLALRLAERMARDTSHGSAGIVTDSGETPFVPYAHVMEVGMIADRTVMYQYAEKVIQLSMIKASAKEGITFLNLKEGE